MEYNYSLKNTLTEDYTEAQAEKLLSEDFIFNDEEGTYDLIEEKFEKKEYVDFIEKEEKKVQSSLSLYEVYRKRKTIDVKYKTEKKEKGFMGFFKNVINKFISKTEKNVSEQRLEELELFLGKGEISHLQKIESFTIKGEAEFLTEKEIRKLQKKNIKYSFLKTTGKTKEEKIIEELQYSGVELKIYEKQYEDHNTEIIKSYKKKVLKEKIILERRVQMETNMNFYIPGVWSRQGNHNEGTVAEFSCDVLIKYISGFNPFDREYFSKSAIQEKVIDIIEEEHPNSVNIRDRKDRQDGFNIDSTIVNK